MDFLFRNLIGAGLGLGAVLPKMLGEGGAIVGDELSYLPEASRHNLPKSWSHTGNPYSSRAITNRAFQSFSPEERVFLEKAVPKLDINFRPTMDYVGGSARYAVPEYNIKDKIEVNFPAMFSSWPLPNGSVVTPEQVAKHELNHILFNKIEESDTSGFIDKVHEALFRAGQVDPLFAIKSEQGHGGTRKAFSTIPKKHRSLQRRLEEPEWYRSEVPNAVNEYLATLTEGSGRVPRHAGGTDFSKFLDDMRSIAMFHTQGF